MRLRSFWKEKRIEVYLAGVIIPSIILGVFTISLLIRQYSFIKRPDFQSLLPFPQDSWVVSFGRTNILAILLVICALMLVLLIGSYFSSHGLQKQLELNRLKSELLATVSHELRTPVASIHLLTERLVRLLPEEKEKQDEYHRLILTQSYRLTQLINNILDFSKIEEGRSGYKFEKTDLAALLNDTLKDYPAKLIKPNCNLEINVADDLPIFYLDKEAMSRAFINILDNAFKFSPLEGVIRINLYKTTKEIFLEVSDQGRGLSEEEKSRIFQRFYHTERGIGLGLKIVRHIVEGHNGRIELESKLNEGSKFKIVLPLKNTG